MQRVLQTLLQSSRVAGPCRSWKPDIRTGRPGASGPYRLVPIRMARPPPPDLACMHDACMHTAFTVSIVASRTANVDIAGHSADRVPLQVEGHQCHRVAHAHRKLMLGRKFEATSPNQRFVEGAPRQAAAPAQKGKPAPAPGPAPTRSAAHPGGRSTAEQSLGPALPPGSGRSLARLSVRRRGEDPVAVAAVRA